MLWCLTARKALPGAVLIALFATVHCQLVTRNWPFLAARCRKLTVTASSHDCRRAV
jgi:hypothetical protein